MTTKDLLARCGVYWGEIPEAYEVEGEDRWAWLGTDGAGNAWPITDEIALNLIRQFTRVSGNADARMTSPSPPDRLREAAQAVADTSPGNYGFLAKWQRLRIVLDEIAAQPAPAAPLDRERLARAIAVAWSEQTPETMPWLDDAGQPIPEWVAPQIADAYDREMDRATPDQHADIRRRREEAIAALQAEFQERRNVLTKEYRDRKSAILEREWHEHKAQEVPA